ncbi:hypothetical protein [Streptomyces tagetis]|uniref:Lipoprotein n=1 Tax=Streptomyces tagetis TaxID=2820809 RepID=A0A941B373_9ACTN|nr:hypothetical protein [Streptomyces sp. RG38]MBQ0829991.1 hypothetical protein [Streptomyces sp. RG38]
MTGTRRVRRSPAAALCLLLAAPACHGPAADPELAGVQRLLDRRAAAVLGHDRAAYARTGAPAGFDALGAVPLAAWSYRVTRLERDGNTATAEADLRYRVDGYDPGAVTARRAVRLVRDVGGQWSVGEERPAPGAGEQPWDQGEVRAVRGERGLVLGVGRGAGELNGLADLADKAVPAVSDAWGEEWPRRVLVLVPRSLEDMARLLGSPPSAYRDIAAVTTGVTGGPAPAPADRIIVNPEAYALLGATGRQVVLTHETAHVATRHATTAATPLWLSEGYADWAAYRGGPYTPAEAAPELARAVREDKAPVRLPADGDFGPDGGPQATARAYEGGWLACRMIADQWGEDRLDAFYRAVGAHGRREGALATALDTVLHTTPQRFTERWTTYLRTSLA